MLRALPLWLLLPVVLLSACALQNPPGTALSKPIQISYAPHIPEVMPTTVGEAATQPAPRDILESDPDTRKLTFVQILKKIIKEQARLSRVSAPLLLSNIDLCKGHVVKILGFSARNRYTYSPKLVSAAQTVLGLGDILQVYDVLKDSGAYRVGLRVGDLLIAANGSSFPKGKFALAKSGSLLMPMLENTDNISIDILRNRVPMSFTIPLTRACGFRVELGNADNVASYSDGYRIVVTQGMMSFAKNDTELANVIAREMAHILLLHGRKLANGPASMRLINALEADPTSRRVVIGTAGIRPMPKTMDADADVLALWMLVHAAYTIDNSLNFWDRLAKAYPENISNSYTALHPDTTYRLAAIREAIVEFNTTTLRPPK